LLFPLLPLLLPLFPLLLPLLFVGAVSSFLQPVNVAIEQKRKIMTENS